MKTKYVATAKRPDHLPRNFVAKHSAVINKPKVIDQNIKPYKRHSKHKKCLSTSD